MLKRVLTAAIAVPIIILIVLFLPLWVFTALFSIVMVLMQIEMLHLAHFQQNKAGIVGAMVVSAMVPWFVYFSLPQAVFAAALSVFLLYEFVLAFIQKNADFKAVIVTLFSALIIPLMLSSVIGLACLPTGIRLIFLPMAVAWMSDAGGYFGGRFLGKHKLCPKISPKKTIEGSVSALVFAVIGSVLYAMVLTLWCHTNVKFGWFILLGILGSVVSQLGDLAFSFIKREQKIKDYGFLLPGHGGMIDRFDSVIFVAPLCWVMVVLTGMAVFL